MPRAAAIWLAQRAMQKWLVGRVQEYGIAERYYDGRWNVYSLDVAEWHILINDGGRVIYASPRSGS